ncbi:uncharacterized protein LOC111084133, partial [Limulus polyphemus]|uniref:Uncharacterized protein LOC111084133 n=1 Tax=Limulus polyphemus TaxID=6850 RepID=A0ABM1RZ19_LIMPO
KMQCDSTSMTAILRVSTPFRGRVYALGHPHDCYALTAGGNGEIAITLPLHGRNCGTKNLGNGTFINNIVVQHHPVVLKNSDRRVEVACDYDEIKRRLRTGKEVEEG